MADGFYIGDIIGNSYTHENEHYNLKTKNFALFTPRSKFSDDTILTIATMDWLLNTNRSSENMLNMIKHYYKKYPDKNPTIYGPAFASWAQEGCKSFRESQGNAGAMRCSPISWYANSLSEIDDLILKGISPTHNTARGKLGAKIVCYSIFFLRNNYSKKELKTKLSELFKLDLDIDINNYKSKYTYTSDAIETVRPALISFLNSTSFEDAIRNAVSFGGDTDTITSITAAISEPFYTPLDKKLIDFSRSFLPKEFIAMINKFNKYKH